MYENGIGYEVRNVKIQWIEFKNLKTDLEIQRIEFYDDITLLVGLSGVGKTQILNAIEYSLNLAVNKDIPLQPYCVNIGILINDDKYEWSYRIENVIEEDLLTENENYCFTYEKLLCNGALVFERNNEDVTIVDYEKVPKPKKDESLLLQYSEDEKFERLVYHIRKLYPIDVELDVRGCIKTEYFNRYKLKIRETMDRDSKTDFRTFSHLPVAVKIYITKNYYYDLYIKIFDVIKELFMEIEDIDVVEDSVRDMFLVAIKVYGKTLLQEDISNGMLKTIYYIVELFTMSENSLVLIDEFENGLGVNCIDLLSEILFFERKDLQFIITSHHPKIINGISMNKWKIIDREGSVVINSDSKKYGIGNSQHDSYFNLLNRWEYEGKIQ